MSLVLLSHQFVVNGVVLSQYFEETVVDTHLSLVRWVELRIRHLQASCKTYTALSNSALTTPR